MKKLNPKTYSLEKADKEITTINKIIVKKSEEIMSFNNLKDKAKQKILEVSARKLYIKSILIQKKRDYKRIKFTKRKEIDRLLES